MRGCLAFALGCVLAASTVWGQTGGSDVTTTAYNRIYNAAGDPLPRHTKIQCGSGMSCVDNPVTGRTEIDCTCSGNGGDGTAEATHGASSCMVIATSTTAYMALGTCADPSEEMVEQPFQNARTFSDLRCITSHPIGAGNSISVTVRVGACGSLVNTLLVCTIAGGAGRTTCNTGATTAGIAAGECLSLKVVTPGTMANLPAVNCTIKETSP